MVWELRVRDPMVPMRLFQSRAFVSGVAASFLFYASMYAVAFFLPQFLQVGQGYGPLGAGLRMLPWSATLFVVAPIGGALVNRIGERALVVVGVLLQAIGIARIALTAAPDLAYGKLVVPLIVAGTGVSMAMPAAQNAVLSSVAVGGGRQGVRRLQHAALPGRRIRDRDRGHGVLGDRQPRFRGDLQHRVLRSDRCLRRNVVPRGNRWNVAARACGRLGARCGKGLDLRRALARLNWRWRHSRQRECRRFCYRNPSQRATSNA